MKRMRVDSNEDKVKWPAITLVFDAITAMMSASSKISTLKCLYLHLTYCLLARLIESKLNQTDEYTRLCPYHMNKDIYIYFFFDTILVVVTTSITQTTLSAFGKLPCSTFNNLTAYGFGTVLETLNGITVMRSVRPEHFLWQ